MNTTKRVVVRGVKAEHGTLPTANRCDCHPCTVALLGATLAATTPGHAITKAQHDALMANRDRPLTQTGIARHRSSGNTHMLGDTK